MCFWNHGISKFEIVKNISISLFGIVGAVTGTFISVEAIIIGFTTYEGDLIVREGMVGEFYQIVLNYTLPWLWWEIELASSSEHLVYKSASETQISVLNVSICK